MVWCIERGGFSGVQANGHVDFLEICERVAVAGKSCHSPRCPSGFHPDGECLARRIDAASVSQGDPAHEFQHVSRAVFLRLAHKYLLGCTSSLTPGAALRFLALLSTSQQTPTTASPAGRCHRENCRGHWCFGTSDLLLSKITGTLEIGCRSVLKIPDAAGCRPHGCGTLSGKIKNLLPLTSRLFRPAAHNI